MNRQPQLIELTDEYATMLHNLVHPYMELEKKGYIMTQLSKEGLDKKRRCGQCNKVLSAKTLKLLNTSPAATRGPSQDNQLGANLDQILRGQQRNDKDSDGRSKQQGTSKKKDGCNFHSGRVGRNRQWSCCGGHPMSQPCCHEEKHVELEYSNGELEANWLFEYTSSHQPVTNAPLVAVAIDCEMGTAESGECELIRVSMVDYFTSVVLLDRLVWPDVKMAHFNTRFSGVSRQDMNEARRNGTCLFGRRGARQAIWNHVGPETIVIGHSLNSDLTSLRWIHHRVVDTLMIEDPFASKEKKRLEKLQEAHDEALADAKENKQPVPPVPQSRHPGLSLKSLTKAYLGRDIQLRGRGHDSLEDATATRDLLHWHVVNRVPQLQSQRIEHRW